MNKPQLPKFRFRATVEAIQIERVVWVGFKAILYFKDKRFDPVTFNDPETLLWYVQPGPRNAFYFLPPEDFEKGYEPL